MLTEPEKADAFADAYATFIKERGDVLITPTSAAPCICVPPWCAWASLPDCTP